MFQTVTAFFTALFLGAVSLCATILDLPARANAKTADPVTAAFRSHDGADPWYYAHDGKYYYCYTYGNGVGVKEADSIAALNDAPHRQAYTAPEGTAYSCEYWAPELHYLEGAWYIYVAADDGRNENHRMYALKSDSPTGPFVMCGKVSSPDDRWAIDGTVLEYGGALYFIWSGWEEETDGEQNLYIARMSDPVTVDGERVRISRPRKKWEKKGMAINEGPEILQTENAVYLVYSASGSWTDEYCLGMLRLCGDDPLDAAAWAKCPTPVFSAAPGAYGPGHCSFVTDARTGNSYIVYHANTESGTGWGGRSIRLQRFRTVCGVPVFGRPAAENPQRGC